MIIPGTMRRTRNIVFVALILSAVISIWQWAALKRPAPRLRRSTSHAEARPAQPSEENPEPTPAPSPQAEPDLGLFADRFFNIDELRNVGSATPEAALETFFWAATSADPEVIQVHIMSRYDLLDDTKTRLTRAILKNLGAVESLKVEARSSRMVRGGRVKIRYQQKDGAYTYGVFEFVPDGDRWKIDVRDIASGLWEVRRWQSETVH
jgi:hypothetical protein